MKSFLRAPLALISSTLAALFVLVAIFAPLLWGEQAVTADAADVNAAPSAEHLLGTDALGRDILLRTLVATQPSLGMAMGATAIAVVLGFLLGALPALSGPRVQRAFGAVINTWLAFPVLLVAMLTAILLGPGSSTVVVALSLTMVPSFARLAQTLSKRVGSSEYVAAARLLGIPKGRQLRHYILPNIFEPIIVNVTLSIGGGLLAISSLSFLGVGVQPPEYDWGRMLKEAFDQVYTSPTAIIGPGVAVALAGVTFSSLGESLASFLRERSLATASGRSSRGRTAPPAPAALGREASGVHAPNALLEVRNLTVSFPTENGWVTPVKDVSFEIAPGEIVGVVGESGSGKSVALMAVAQLTAAGGVVQANRLEFGGIDLTQLGDAELRTRLGTDIGVVFQDSLTALNPAIRVGRQLAEVVEVHGGGDRPAARQRAVDALESVKIADPERRAQQFPHEFSGGMRQRALIAMAKIGDPRLIIADEPTTALDVTVQRHVLALLRGYCAESGAAAIVVSHDIAVLGELCERVLVMYGGRIVEVVDSADLAHPERLRHPYSRALVESLPDLDTDRSQPLATIPEVHPEWWAEAHLRDAEPDDVQLSGGPVLTVTRPDSTTLTNGERS